MSKYEYVYSTYTFDEYEFVKINCYLIYETYHDSYLPNCFAYFVSLGCKQYTATRDYAGVVGRDSAYKDTVRCRNSVLPGPPIRRR